MEDDKTRAEAIGKLNDLINDIDFAMLTTVDTDGVLRSRPMQTQKAEFDGELWFFTSDKTHKVEEIERDNRVNASYAKPEDNVYVSVSGAASISKDRAKMEEFWNPILKAWFPKGLDDPNICLLKVDVEQAEYWDSPSSTLVQIVGFVKAIITGKRADGGENEKINL
ncbi:MAG: pyridoxamine 5'-phosphate oxidase family protein [Acidobacteria bacterium]|nr:pyridoxamine 5'-phosphate oxidase family protein [Acidobacteriota bacterium]MCA1637065.1 pyridoxamine 5'-phosphate oxidase family protein [Acidobacteriota bacterium]